MDADDPLRSARRLAMAGDYDRAIRAAWKATRPAAVAQDRDRLVAAVEFGREVADATTGTRNERATEFLRYCMACITTPRESLSTRLSFATLFRRRQSKVCPDCAEQVAIEARVCRFCGFTFVDRRV